MAGLAFLMPDEGNEVDFDLVMSESHTNASTVTDYPVEHGVNPSDHVKPDPITLSLEVWVTNTPTQPTDPYGGFTAPLQLDIPPLPPPLSPFDALGGAISDALSGPPAPVVIQTLVFPTPFDKVADTHLALTTLERFGGTMTVVTSTTNYPNMILTKVGYEKAEPGCGTFHLEFKQILIVTTSTVSAPKPAEPRGAPKASKGSQGAKPAADANQKSVAKKAIDAATKALGL